MTHIVVLLLIEVILFAYMVWRVWHFDHVVAVVLAIALGAVVVVETLDLTDSPKGKSPALRQPVPECRNVVLT